MNRDHSPFPGMDPYLENPRGWRGVHARFLTYLGDAVAEVLPPRYYARLEDRVYLDTDPPATAMLPDVRVVEQPGPRAGGSTAVVEADPAVLVSVRPETVEERYLEIRDASTGHRVVTVVELLSPTNKRPGTDGGRSYRAKQQEVLSSDANLVEIDLLRAGEHVVAAPAGALRRLCGPYHYLVVARRAARPEVREAYPIRLRSRLPRIAVPLRAPDPDVVADLQPILERVYRMGAYGATIQYAAPPDPPLEGEDAAWARDLLVPPPSAG
ncbi:MAG: DUF4058 family protein [Planctomycetes bacterium]|nr:DUF4058 family protein [Planctomycetota bacterium]